MITHTYACIHVYLYTCIPVYLYTCSWACRLIRELANPQAPLGESGPQVRRGVGATGSSGSPRLSATGASGQWACRLVGAPPLHPDEQGQQICKTSSKLSPQAQGTHIRVSGPQARRGGRALRRVGEAGAPGTSGVGACRHIREFCPSARRAPRPGSQTKMLELQCSQKSPSGARVSVYKDQAGGQRGQIALRFASKF